MTLTIEGPNLQPSPWSIKPMMESCGSCKAKQMWQCSTSRLTRKTMQTWLVCSQGSICCNNGNCTKITPISCSFPFTSLVTKEVRPQPCCNLMTNPPKMPSSNWTIRKGSAWRAFKIWSTTRIISAAIATWISIIKAPSPIAQTLLVRKLKGQIAIKIGSAVSTGSRTRMMQGLHQCRCRNRLSLSWITRW